MSDLPKNSEVISNKVVDLLVSNAFRKNGVNIDSVKGKLAEEQKQAIKDMLDELTKQVETFVKQKPSD